jgi:tetratricopeptide (TPR) repeat protein
MENFKPKLKEIASSREMKGQEEETLRKIDDLLPKAQEKEDYKTVATLYWESHLVWQHKVMNQKSKPESDQDAEAVKEGAQKMMEFAEKAKDVIEEHGFEDMAGGAYRFLGRSATYLGDHQKAKDYYETAISKYSGKNLNSKLEVNGFLAETLIRLHNFDEGLELAKTTYDDFSSSEIGQNLKEEDYFVWAVWMSGIPPRVVNALEEEGAEYNREEMKKWLEDTKKELADPSGEVTWGNGAFRLRMDEINSALEKVS